jgi:hypothetical protein
MAITAIKSCGFCQQQGNFLPGILQKLSYVTDVHEGRLFIEGLLAGAFLTFSLTMYCSGSPTDQAWQSMLHLQSILHVLAKIG